MIAGSLLRRRGRASRLSRGLRPLVPWFTTLLLLVALVAAFVLVPSVTG